MRKQRASSPFMKEALPLSKKAPVIPWGKTRASLHFMNIFQYIHERLTCQWETKKPPPERGPLTVISQR